MRVLGYHLSRSDRNELEIFQSARWGSIPRDLTFLAIYRLSKFAYVEFRDDAGKMNGADFLRGVMAALPHAIHTVLTDNGMAFADLPKNRGQSAATESIFGRHIFDHVCKQHGIQHKLTKPYDRGPTAKRSA